LHQRIYFILCRRRVLCPCRSRFIRESATDKGAPHDDVRQPLCVLSCRLFIEITDQLC
jgi:hypothetical protein